MFGFSQLDTALIWQRATETLRIEPWGADSLRVRATKNPSLQDTPGALLEPIQCSSEIVITDDEASIRNGKLEARVGKYGHLTFYRTDTGEVVLDETLSSPSFPSVFPASRGFKAVGGELYRTEVRFVAEADERFYGLGQHRHGLLDQKGCVIELVQRNCEVNIPFLVSNRLYGFLWNNPAVGTVELGHNRTRWIADGCPQLDYWVTVGDNYAEIMRHYADATGHAPMLPEFASGFWQSKLRYMSQDEVLTVAREYQQRGLPLSVIVVDFFHWVRQGEWTWDAEKWPDPAWMVRELEAMGIKTMVSIWPTVNPSCANIGEFKERGMLVGTDRGLAQIYPFIDTRDGLVSVFYYDPTNPEARDYVWAQIKQHHYDIGVTVFWLDSCEPDIDPFDHDNLRFHAGPGVAVANRYPLDHERMIFDGLTAAGETAIITLCRSAWAGSQRYGAAVWSGDIPSTFASLREQIRAGLNIAMSGIPWWTTDIGGFSEGDTRDPVFRELIVRWFQYGVFCPLFRLHGIRLPIVDGEICGAPNEVWSFGEEAYEQIVPLLFLRERLRPYIMAQMRIAHETGTPPMRPLFYDFHYDTGCYEIDDQYLLGADLLICPVAELRARSRRVYLPSGATWTDAWTGEAYDGGQWLEADAPLERIPVYLKNGATLPIREQEG